MLLKIIYSDLLVFKFLFIKIEDEWNFNFQPELKNGKLMFIQRGIYFYQYFPYCIDYEIINGILNPKNEYE